MSPYTIKYTFSKEGVTIENIMVCLTVFHAKGMDNVVEHPKPSLWRLLENIERATQLINQTILPVSNKTRRLLHVDFLFLIELVEKTSNQ